jgi:preprotein translocase subunit SecE
MTTNVDEQKNGSLDTLKWILVALVIGAAVAGNQMFADVSVLYRAIAIVVAFAISIGIALQTVKGKSALEFARESHKEIRKVVWPTPQETRITTLIVLAATALMGLVLWGLDAILLAIVNFITGV